MELEAFELVILRRPIDAPEYDDATLEDIQRQHLAFWADLREKGFVASNGPVLDQPDESLRGLSLLRTGSLDQARALSLEDPAVKAGRLAVDVMTWCCPPGSLTHPGTPITIPDE